MIIMGVRMSIQVYRHSVSGGWGWGTNAYFFDFGRAGGFLPFPRGGVLIGGFWGGETVEI